MTATDLPSTVVEGQLFAAVGRAIAGMNLPHIPGALHLHISVAPSVLVALPIVIDGEGAWWRGIRIAPHPGPFDPSTKDDVVVTYTLTRTETLT